MAVIQERERLAREMHDGLAQELGLLHMKLCGALERSTDAEAVAQAMREMVYITDHAYEDVRQSIFGLRTFVSRGLGLVPRSPSCCTSSACEMESGSNSKSPTGPSVCRKLPSCRWSASSRKRSRTCGSMRAPITPWFASRGRATGSGYLSKIRASDGIL